MTTQRRTGGLTGLLLGLLLVLGMVPALALVTAPTSLADQDDELAITVTSISPTVLRADGNLIITGVLTNQSDQPLRGVSVHLWRDATPIVSLPQLDAALEREVLGGAVLESPPAQQVINDGDPLQPGETAEFSVSAALGSHAEEQTWLSQPDSAYLVGVEVRGWSGAGSYGVLGHATAPLPYPGTETVPIATVVVLNARPSLLPLAGGEDGPAVFGDDSLAGALVGRLETLLRLARQDEVLTVIDPALYDEVAAMADGYQVLQPDGSLVDGSARNSELAADWLTRLDAVARQDRLARSVYGSVDVSAVAAAGRPDILQRAGEALPADHPLAGLPLVVAPADYQVDVDALDLLGGAEPWLVLAGNLAGSQLLQEADNGVRLLQVAGTGQRDDWGATQQRGVLLSSQLVAAQQGLVLTTVVDSQVQAETELSEPGWRTRQSVASVIEGSGEAAGLWLSEVPTVEVPAELLAASDTAAAVLATWGDLVTDPDAEEPAAGDPDAAPTSEAPTGDVIAVAWSTRFDRDAAAQVDWLARSTAPASRLLGAEALQLRISDWVTTSEDDNLMPVTVINNTAQRVWVRVLFDSQNPLRISVDDSELFAVEPGDSSTVRVQPHTYGNGRVAVSAQLVTAGGHPVGERTAFIVNGTTAGQLSWVLILASGVVLLVGTALRVRTVRQDRREQRSP